MQISSEAKLAQPWNEGLIDFAFRTYENTTTKEFCLKLQNEYNANVNIVLWCCWLEREEIYLSSEWLDDVLIAVDTLSQLTVSRLREVRRVINEAAGFTRVQAKLINKHILNAELTAEKIFLQRLQDLTKRFIEAERPSFSDPSAAPNLDISYYLRFLKVPDANATAQQLQSQINVG